ncbi:MAG: N-acetylmuramoyl-L-alanine amidase, partial [Clostridia bacterium]|nr:N-acetylmuramoyl-L-alanine amidase [Clostridia bacterium]
GVINVIFKKRIIGISVWLIAIVTIALFSGLSQEVIKTSVKAEIYPQIILDAGHGGFDGGAVANDGTVEKDINLNITLTLEKMLEQSGFEVVMTRTDDSSTESNSNDKIAKKKKSDLNNRLELMKKYDDAVFVSIHLNKFTTSAARGSQIFYSSKVESSKNLADSIQNSIVEKIQPENTRVNKKSTSSTYILHNATVPAVIVECGFLSNKAELELLKNEEYQNKMAFCIYCGILDFYNNKEIKNVT